MSLLDGVKGIDVISFHIELHIESGVEDGVEGLDQFRPTDYEELPTLIFKMYCHNVIIHDLGEMKYEYSKETNTIHITSTNCDIENFMKYIQPIVFSYFKETVYRITHFTIN